MLFNSVTFIVFFLPAALLLYYVTPHKYKNEALLLESLVFYAFGNVRYLPLAAGLVVWNYLAARMMGKESEHPGKRRIWLAAGLAVNLLLLISFKYGSYLSELLNRMTQGDITFFDMLPLGIS